MNMDLVLEERYAPMRDEIYRLLTLSTDYSPEVATLIVTIFAPLSDMSEHGPVLWAMMVKTQGIKHGILGAHFKIYLQYYYLYLVSASQRAAPLRALDPNSQAFLVCCAAFGYTRGMNEFDKAFFNQDVITIDNAIIDKPSFLNFFDGPDDQFSFLHSWRVIDRLWDAWDCASPVLIHGFLTAGVSEKLLAARVKQPGSFLLRFSSRGGLAVDYIRNGKMEKAHWKYQQLVDINALRDLLWDTAHWGALLEFLVDTTIDFGFNTNVLPKSLCFPQAKSYIQDDTMDDAPIVAPAYSMTH